MLPEPIVGKHYKLEHKTPGINPFRGYVLIRDVGFINGAKIFSTSQNGNYWYWWSDYNYEYIGDLA